MFYHFLNISTFSILLPVLICLLRFRSLKPHYLLFALLLCLGALAECFSLIAIEYYGNNHSILNVYAFTEALLIPLMFHQWLKLKKQFLILLLLSIVLVWLLENLLTDIFLAFNSAFQIYYSVIIALLAIRQMNDAVTRQNEKMIKNPVFLISLGLLIYHSVEACIEVFYSISFQFNTVFYERLFVLLSFVNLTANLLFTVAALYIPSRKKYSLLT